MMVYRFLLTLGLGISVLSINGSVPNNLFNPYDILLYKPFSAEERFEFGVVYEGAFRSFGFQTDPDDRIVEDTTGDANLFRRPVTPMQLWHDSQNFCAALSGASPDSAFASHASLLNIKGQRVECNLNIGAQVSIPVNLMLSARFALPYNLIFAFYVPVLKIGVKNIQWSHKRKDTTSFTSRLDEDFLNTTETLSNKNFRQGWERFGLGDCSAVVWWSRYYRQYKPLLKGVTVHVRGGTVFPTGSKAHEDIVFDIPFGHGQGFGVLFGGTLELSLGHYCKFGIDGEFSHFLGSSGKRRLQTNRLQTNLLLFQSGHAHVDPGLLQHYTLYLTMGAWNGLSTTISYQHSRQHETMITPSSPHFDAKLINDDETIQNWTTHSIVWFLNYDPPGWEDCAYLPRLSAFVKNGFNGKRALLFDTAGVQVALGY